MRRHRPISIRLAGLVFCLVLGAPPASGDGPLAEPGPAESAPLDCAVWVVRNALQSPRTWRRTLDAVERVGCRAVYLQVSGRWDAYYPSAVFGPPVRPPEGWQDPFGSALAQAHARGIEVHAWVNAMLAWSAPDPPRDPDHVFLRHPEWFVTDPTGRSIRALDRAALDRSGLVGEGWFLDPARTEVRTELRRFVLELTLRYPVDGIHLDYIRYPAGWAPIGGAEEITRLVGLIHDDLAEVRPGTVLSAAVLPRPDEARRSFGQDWERWLSTGAIDLVVPMVYRDSPARVTEIVRSYPGSVPRDRVWVGVRLDRLGPEETRRAMDALTVEGVRGVALFSHNLLMEDGRWRRADGF